MIFLRKIIPCLTNLIFRTNWILEDDFLVYLTSSRKIITAIVDVRGSGGQSNEHLFQVYHDPLAVQVVDIKNVTLYLKKQFPFIDSQRVGIVGEEFGGSLTVMALEKDRSSIFTCGISGTHIKQEKKMCMLSSNPILFFP